MSTAGEIFDVMAEEISSHTRHPLDAFGFSGYSLSYGTRFRDPEPLWEPPPPTPTCHFPCCNPREVEEPLPPPPVQYMTLKEALAAEARGEGRLSFVNGVPRWTPASAGATPGT